MGGSRSNSSSTQQTITNTVSDSYNQTLNRVMNLSDVGNVSLDFGSQNPGQMPSASVLLPIGLIGLAFSAIVILGKR